MQKVQITDGKIPISLPLLNTQNIYCYRILQLKKNKISLSEKLFPQGPDHYTTSFCHLDIHPLLCALSQYCIKCKKKKHNYMISFQECDVGSHVSSGSLLSSSFKSTPGTGSQHNVQFGSLYPCILHPQIQPAVDQKYLKRYIVGGNVNE